MNLDKARAIEGWMFESELVFLAEQASKAKTIIEFGCYKGRSTRALADNTTGRVYAVDPWNGDYPANDGTVHGIRTDVYHEFSANLSDKIIDQTVIPIQTYSTKFLEVTNYAPGFFDFGFIDGDHRYETVLHDIKLLQSLVKKGGILAGHDYSHWDWPGVKQAVDELFPKVNHVDSIWWLHV